MDYSLLLGIHDCVRAEAEGYDVEDLEGEEDEDSEGGGERPPPWGSTPPDSPQQQLMRESSLQYEGGIVPELDIYAIPSCESTYRLSIYYLGLKLIPERKSTEVLNTHMYATLKIFRIIY